MSISGGQTGPSVSSTGAVTLDSGLWSSFANAKGDASFLTSWLALVISKLPAATLGVVMEADHAQGAFVPIAIAPDPRRDISGFREVAEKVLTSGRPATMAGDDSQTGFVAYPIQISGQPIRQVVALELRGGASSDAQAALREIHWAAGWLSSKAWASVAEDQADQVKRAAVALDLLALISEHKRPEPAAMALVNELQTVMAADQISVGMVIGRQTSPRIRLLAKSYSAWFRKRSAISESLETAMEEAFDQNGTVAVPPLPDTTTAIAVAHDDHVKNSRSVHVLTTPLQDHDGPVGALTVERRRDMPFDAGDVRMLESIATLVGPVLEMKRRNRRWIGGRLWDTVLHALSVVLGPRRLSWKLLALVLAALVAAAATVKGPFQLSADGVVRGAVLRAAVAPFNGFIDRSALRAGDVVARGDVLAELDATDLRLEELRWQSELDRLAAQQRDAMAQYERSEVAFLEAQIAQAQAQLDLTRTQLSRTRITSPIAGMIVSGDLSQKLGAPVQPGEVLFEITPLQAYRLDIYVHERDLRYVTVGQNGHVALAGRPDEGLPFAVSRITPVSEPREGANTFRVEATLETLPDDVRPGMEGVAKISAGEALVIWTWSRGLINWLRETAWTWQP